MSRSITKVEDGRIRRPGEIALIAKHPTYTNGLLQNLKRMRLPDLDHLARLVDAANHGGDWC